MTVSLERSVGLKLIVKARKQWEVQRVHQGWEAWLVWMIRNSPGGESSEPKWAGWIGLRAKAEEMSTQVGCFEAATPGDRRCRPALHPHRLLSLCPRFEFLLAAGGSGLQVKLARETFGYVTPWAEPEMMGIQEPLKLSLKVLWPTCLCSGCFHASWGRKCFWKHIWSAWAV